jgi:hypothetical protein
MAGWTVGRCVTEEWDGRRLGRRRGHVRTSGSGDRRETDDGRPLGWGHRGSTALDLHFLFLISQMASLCCYGSVCVFTMVSEL